MPNFYAALSNLDASIEQFKQTLPTIERSPQPTVEVAHMLLLIHGFAHSATIQLHKPFMSGNSNSMARSLTSANTIVRVIQALGMARMEFINPIVGVCIFFKPRKSCGRAVAIIRENKFINSDLFLPTGYCKYRQRGTYTRSHLHAELAHCCGFHICCSSSRRRYLYLCSQCIVHSSWQRSRLTFHP
jgi:hypothetical protein